MASNEPFENNEEKTTSGRFVSITDSDVNTFLEGEANKNTQRKTQSDIALVNAFLLAENENRRLEDLPPADLDAYLSRFLLSVRKKSGKEYEPTTLRGFIASVERNLKKQIKLLRVD